MSIITIYKLKINLLIKHIWYYGIKWSPWNPWTLAVLNMAWNKYTQSVLYAERKKVTFRIPGSSCDFAEHHYTELGEVKHFIRKFTLKDKMKIIFIPFSCGEKYKLPFRKLLGLS